MDYIQKVVKKINTELVSINDHEEIERIYNNIKADNYCEELNGYKPDKSRTIKNINSYIESLFEEYEEVIVFAFDALSFKYYQRDIRKGAEELDKAYLGVLTSVFPSTSSTSWATVLTDSTPSEHGIYGTAFLLEGYNKNYIWQRNALGHKGERILFNERNSRFKLILSNKPTLFEKLNEKDVTSYTLGSHFKGEYSPLIHEIMKGSVRIRIDTSHHMFAENPDKMVTYFMEETENILKDNKGKKLIWNYIDTDDFIHKYGYEELTKYVSWDKIFKYWKQHSKPGRIFLFISDHGQIQQRGIDINILKESESNDELAYNTGGAGRVLYFYPEKEKEASVMEWLKQLMGDTAQIITKAQAIEYGLLEENGAVLSRVGDIIAIGHKENFPSAGYNYLNEHGALAEEEMFVPIIVYPCKEA